MLQGDKMEDLISNKKYFVAPLNSSKAYQFICMYHYSHIGFKKASINLGIFTKEDKKLVGVLQWGCAAQTKIRLDRYVKEPIETKEYLELNRFAIADSEGKNSESQAISLGIKWIKRNRPDIRLLVSYSGRIEGNYGYIYQATNWEYLGYFISNGFWKLDNLERHAITVQMNYKKYGQQYKNSLDYLIHTYKDVRQYDSKQFIYIIRLDKTLTPASPILPYPKPATEYPIQTKEIIYLKSDNPPETLTERPKIQTFYYDPDELLFTRRCLRRRGELKELQYYYLMYDNKGKLEKVYNSVEEINREYPEYLTDGIRKALKKQKRYKDKYFRQVRQDKEYPDEIDVNVLCWIDGIPYNKQVDIVKAFGISKQAVSACVKRKGKTIAGKEIEWND